MQMNIDIYIRFVVKFIPFQQLIIAITTCCLIKQIRGKNCIILYR